VFTILTTWQRGRVLVTERRIREEGSLRSFVKELHGQRPPLQRVEGTAVFLNRGKTTTPLAMRANVEHNHILHEHVVILTLETLPVPHVPGEQRVAVDDLGFSDDGISHVAARFGYKDASNVPAVLPLAVAAGLECPLEVEQASYFLSTIDLYVGEGPGMARWRKHLFVATSRITADAADYFGLPRERTVIMGSRMEV
jgi:KUP system potassium uptake protein